MTSRSEHPVDQSQHSSAWPNEELYLESDSHPLRSKVADRRQSSKESISCLLDLPDSPIRDKAAGIAVFNDDITQGHYALSQISNLKEAP